MSVLLKYDQHNTNTNNPHKYNQHKYNQPTNNTQYNQPKAHPVLLTVKHFNHAVLAGTEKVMGAWDKTNAHDGVGMGKHRFVAISKIQAPDFHVLVAADGHQQGVVGRDVHGHHRQFVPVPGQIVVGCQLLQWSWCLKKKGNGKQEQKKR